VDPVDAEEIRRRAAARTPGFYQAKVDADQVGALGELTRAGMSVVDFNVTLGREPGGDVESGVPVEPAGVDDAGEVLEIAENEFSASRFHMDPKTPDDVARRIKRDWVRAYVDGERGHRLLVARGPGHTPGFLAELDRDGTRVIDLVAVRGSARRSGVGRALVAEVIRDAPASVEVGTQAANVPALRFYEELGFKVSRARYVLHLRLPREGGADRERS